MQRQTALNQTTRDSYTTVTVCVLLYAVRPERSVSEVEGRACCRALFDSAAHAATQGRACCRALFDSAAHAATLRANGDAITQEVQDCANVMCFDLEETIFLDVVATLVAF
jgi:hypothetical protein